MNDATLYAEKLKRALAESNRRLYGAQEWKPTLFVGLPDGRYVEWRWNDAEP